MQGLQKGLFLSMVCFFSGATVFVAAKDIHSKLVKPSEEQVAQARKLVQDLRGELLIQGSDGYTNPTGIPVRTARSYLSDHDKGRLKSFVTKILNGGDAPAVQDKKAEAEEVK